MAQTEEQIEIFLLKEPNAPEAVYVSCVENRGDYFIGILLKEPKQDFGFHKGEKVYYFPFTDSKGTTTFICDLNPKTKLTEEALADGSVLKQAISVFNGNRTQENMVQVMGLLRDSYVWIPCTADSGEKGQEAGWIPEILKNGDKYFFPAFSGETEMDNYGNRFSKVKRHFLEVLSLAKSNDKDVSGVVLNPFSEPFVLDKKLWELVESMRSRLSE